MNKLSSIQESFFPDWLVQHLQPLNTDFDSRVVVVEEDAHWRETSLQGVHLRLLECVPGPKYRVAAQLKFDHKHLPALLERHPDLEFLIQQGHLASRMGDYHANWYFRTPNTRVNQKMTFQRAATMKADDTALVYLAAGQMKNSDLAWRKIDTSDEDNWLPGPVDGTDVLPLHGHGSCNVMLVRWNKAAAFKTRIDPRGEELLVIRGAVNDASGSYHQNSWIRNPIAAWQSWGAKAGTVVYYKNGHFANSDSI